jgi:hypothetical protein
MEKWAATVETGPNGGETVVWPMRKFLLFLLFFFDTN